MALRYVIKKRTFGFDKTKAEKYVAQNVITNTVDFRDLCEEITNGSQWSGKICTRCFDRYIKSQP